MDNPTRKYGVSDAPDTAVDSGAQETNARGRSNPVRTGSDQPTNRRSSMHKPKAGGYGYDFSGSYEQTRRVRFKFGGHSLAVEATLAKLFESLTVECSGVLVQPQWKHFRHFDMLKNDQIRLSNGIWRSWHIKYQKGLEPLFCTFDLNPNLNDHTRPEAVVLEGKYQRRKVEAVAREYLKWRMFHREKHRQGGSNPDPHLAHLLENAHGDELGGGSTAELPAMQVDPPMSGFIQLDELTDPFFMGLGQDYYAEYNASSNAMFQPKMDVLSSALDEFLGKLEPMEVLLSRSSSSSYQSPLVAFPPVMSLASSTPTPTLSPHPHHPGTQQQMLSPQMTPSLSPHTSHLTPPTMGVSHLTNFIGEPSSSMFSPFSPPPPLPTYLTAQTQPEERIFSSTDVTRTPPPEAQFSLPPDVAGGSTAGMGVQQLSSMFQFPIKGDPSPENLQSPRGEFTCMSPSTGGPNPAHIPFTSANYNSSAVRSQSNYSNMLLSSRQPMSDVVMDTRQSMLSQPIPVETPPTLGLQQSMSESMTTTAPPYRLSLSPVDLGGVATAEGGVSGGILGSKRKDGTHQYLQGVPGSKRRSPYNSQSDLPVWTEEGFSGASPMPPPSVPLSARRASIGSAAQVSDERPVLQKNKSEPTGSLLLKEQLKLLSQQNEQHSQELDKQQSLARQQYHDVLHQYKMQIVGQEQLTESDKQLLRTVLSKPALVDILRTLLTSVPPSSASTSPSFTQPTPSPLLHTPSPTPVSTLPPPTHTLVPPASDTDTFMQTGDLSSPTEAVKVTEFQSRLLVAAAVQASGGGSRTHPPTSSSPPTNTSSSSTPEPTSFMSEPDLLSPEEGRPQLGGGATEALLAKMKSSRGLSSDQKEAYREIRRQSHISAEQKRRGTIKQGFEQLQSLVIDPSSYPSGKVSKATILEKTVEFIEHAHHLREHRERQMKTLKKEQEELNGAIARCQENLPASGVPVTRQRFEENRRRFQEYVQKRTLQNYKFWIYSIILQKLFESYNSTVSTSNQEELCRTVLAWFEQNCSLHALRPVVMNSLKELSTKTSILSEPSQVPQQLVQYAKQQLKTSQDFNS